VERRGDPSSAYPAVSTSLWHLQDRQLSREWGCANLRVSQFVPSFFWHPVRKSALSLRVELPSTLSPFFLSSAPEDAPAEAYPLHLDLARRRNHGRRV
jgi:hypothetical protein